MLKRFIFGLLFIILAALAVPTVMVMLFDNEPQAPLDAGQSDSQWKFLQDYAKLINYAKAKGYKLTAGELYRTMYQQRYYVTHGLSWTYNSRHLKRKAGDLNLFIDGKYSSSCADYEVLGSYWESLDEHNRWGGRWKHRDCPHFERRD